MDLRGSWSKWPESRDELEPARPAGRQWVGACQGLGKRPVIEQSANSGQRALVDPTALEDEIAQMSLSIQEENRGVRP